MKRISKTLINKHNTQAFHRRRHNRVSILAMLLALNMFLSSCGNKVPPVTQTSSSVTSSTVETTASLPTTIPPTDSNEQNVKTLADFQLDGGSIISILKSKETLATAITEAEITTMINDALSYSGEFDEMIKDGQTVVLKPNLVQMRVDSTGELLNQTVNGVTTDWRVTNAVVKRIRKLNPSGKIYIVEGSAVGSTREVFEYYHYTKEYMPDVDGFISLGEDMGAWQDFKSPEITKVSLPNGLLHDQYYFSRLVYEADVLISIPCLKTSSGVVVTAGIKNVSLGTPPGNIYGVSATDPSKENMVSHKIVDGELDKWIYDYFMCKPIDYVIVDGLQGFQHGPVPMSGERKDSDKMNMGIILAGKDAVAVDTTCALITGWDNESVGYLNHFKDNHIGNTDVSKIQMHGYFVDELRKNFSIKRPDLGGIQITDHTAPDTKIIHQNIEADKLTIQYETDHDTIKVEVYVDGILRMIDTAETGFGNIVIALGQLDKEPIVKLIAYDRFLNKSVCE